jgi:hypothetical protein
MNMTRKQLVKWWCYQNIWKSMKFMHVWISLFAEEITTQRDVLSTSENSLAAFMTTVLPLAETAPTICTLHTNDSHSHQKTVCISQKLNWYKTLQSYPFLCHSNLERERERCRKCMRVFVLMNFGEYEFWFLFQNGSTSLHKLPDPIGKERTNSIPYAAVTVSNSCQ